MASPSSAASPPQPPPESDAPPAPLAARRSPRRRWLDAWSVVFAFLPLVPMAITFSGVRDYRRGRENAEPLFIDTIALLAVALAFVCTCALVMRTYSLWQTPDRRRRAASSLLLVIVPLSMWPIMCGLRPLPGDSYTRGLVDWAQRNVATAPIRQWHTTLTPVAAPVAVPAASWPPQVAALRPAAVEQLPGNGGIVLQWGKLATWGTSRKLCIGPNDAAQPPDDIHHVWTQAAPGVFVSLQSGG
jgi:hypothetical protein